MIHPDLDIGISSILQPESDEGATVPLVLMIHRATNGQMTAAIQRIAELTEKVLGDRVKASAWLQRRNRALGGEPPLSWLDTDLGSRQVEDILGRLAHGVTG